MILYDHEKMTVALEGDQLIIAFNGIIYQKSIFNWFKLAVMQDNGMRDYLHMNEESNDLVGKK